MANPGIATSETLTSTSENVSSLSVMSPSVLASTDLLKTPPVLPVTPTPPPPVLPVTPTPPPPVLPVTPTPTPPVLPVTPTPPPPVLPVTPTPTPPVLPVTPTPIPPVLPVTPTPTPPVLPVTPTPTPPVLPVTPTPTPPVLPVTPTPTPPVLPLAPTPPILPMATPSITTQQPVIDLTIDKESRVTQPSIDVSQSTKSLLSTSVSQFPQLGSKRSPSPSFIQPGRGRSPSPAFMSRPQSHSQMLPGQSLPPGIAFLQHSHASRSDTNTHDTAPPATKKKRMFHRELMSMMRGFGDDPNPHSETVDLIEELVIRFITEMTQKAMEVGKSGRVQVNDIIFIIRKDQKKYSRVKELLTMKEQIDKAKKAFTEDAETSDDNMS